MSNLQWIGIILTNIVCFGLIGYMAGKYDERRKWQTALKARMIYNISP